MKISFTGSSKWLNPDQREYVKRCLMNLPEAQAFYTGGAAGIDTFVHLFLVDSFPGALHYVLYPEASWSNRVAPVSIALKIKNKGRTASDAYMSRNDELVKAADLLVAFPREGKEELRSGTWATVRRARKAGVSVKIFPLEDA